MTPHYNFYPPSGSVLDQNETRAYWNGRSWMLNGRVYGVPSGHRLVGRAGGPLDAWYYDWGSRAWMEPDRRPALPPPSRRPAPSRLAPQPQPQPPKPAPPPEKDKAMEKCGSSKEKEKNVLEYLVKHPIAPLLGGFVLIGSMLADEPTPPQIPDGLPEGIQKQWLMIYSQNQQRFARRQQIWDLVGKTLLGYADTNAILAALPPRKVG
jgi:hypothetical protein